MPTDTHVLIITAPILANWAPNGDRITAHDVNARNLREPLDCSHAGAQWSASLALICQTCGARMFMPAAQLKYLPGSTITAMEYLWEAAGWPEWRNGAWAIDWRQGRWTLMPHRAFWHCAGGLPVRNERLAIYAAAVSELEA